MSITLSDAQAILAKLIELQKSDPVGALQSITMSGYTVSFKTADDLIKGINYWSSVVTRLQRAAAGGQRHGRSRAVFNDC
jgi:hypothetical protein